MEIVKQAVLEAPLTISLLVAESVITAASWSNNLTLMERLHNVNLEGGIQDATRRMVTV